MKKILMVVGFVFSVLYTNPLLAQSNPTVRLPMCLEYPSTNVKVPCTGVVPVDATTGNALNWMDVMNGGDSTTPYVPTNRGGQFGTTATQLMPVNNDRRGFAIQIQSTTANCYINDMGAATTDFNSLKITAGDYFEPDHRVPTTAISIICSAANTPVYVREW